MPAASASPCRFGADVVLCSLVRGQASNGLLRPDELFIGVPSLASLFVDRVVRLVSGGETGANLGASGVFAGAEWAFMGVCGMGASSAMYMSSTSVAASSSSSATSGLFVGNSSRGLTEDRVSGWVSSGSTSAEASCSSGPVPSFSENLRKNFLPRLRMVSRLQKDRKLNEELTIRKPFHLRVERHRRWTGHPRPEC